MRGPALFGWWVVLALVLAATPAQAAPLSGDLNMLRGVELAGDIAWTGAASILDLDARDGIPGYTLRFSAAQATVHVRSWSAPSATHAFVDGEHGSDETVPLRDVSLEGLVLHDGAHLTLSAPDAVFQGTASAAGLQTAREAAASVDPTHDGRYESGVRPYSLFFTDQIVLTPEALSFEGSGDMVLAFWEADLTLASSDGTRSFIAGDRFDRGGPIPFVDDAYVREIVWIELKAASFAGSWSAPSVLSGPAPSLSVSGRMSTSEASGNLVLDRVGIQPRRQAMAVEGSFQLAPRLSPDADAVRTPVNRMVEPYDRFSGGVQGEAEDVYLAGARLSAPEVDGASAAAVGAAGLGAVALLAALYRYGPLAFAFLYSRLEQGELLANPIRSQIYDIVKANPGISARQVHRLSTASWGTVVHHLHKLQDAGYVAARPHGRAKCYYENHGKWDQYQADLAVLSGEKTGRIAAAVAVVPGRDQAQIMERTGLPQSTVSYHLLKLERAHLVTKERAAGTYIYYPASHLREVITLLQTNGGALRVPEGAVVS